MKLSHCTAGSILMVLTGVLLAQGAAASEAAQQGKALFNQHCAVCHRAGGNIISPQKTLLKKDMKANKINTADDIVNIMRNPGPGMTRFTAGTLPDKDARLIAEYIMKTYK